MASPSPQFHHHKEEGGDESATISGFFFWKGKAQTGQKKVLFPLLFPSVVTAGKQCVCVQTLQGEKQVCLLSLGGGEGIFLNFRNFASPFFLLLVCSFWEIEARVTFFYFPGPHSLFYAVGPHIYIPRKQKGEAKFSLC